MSPTWLVLALCVAAEPAPASGAPQTQLFVHTVPPGAEVQFDGKVLGRSDGLFPVEPGDHKVVVSLEGFQREEKQVNLVSGRIKRLEITLKPASESQAVPQADNRLKNASCETGDKTPEDWQQGAAVPGVRYRWDRSVACDGKASLCLEKTTQRYFPIAQWFQTMERTGKQPTLVVSAQVKAQRMTKAILDAVFLDDNGQWISHQWVAYIGAQQAGDPPADHDWKLYAGKVTIPPGTKKIMICLQDYGPGKVWFDDIRAGYAP